MSNQWKIAFGLGVALGYTATIASAATPGAATPGGAGDKAQIEALEAKFAAGFSAKDVSKNHVVLCPRRTLRVRRSASSPARRLGGLQERLGRPLRRHDRPVTFKISDLDVTAVGSVAYSHSIQDVHWTGAGGAAVEMTVRVTDVYRKVAGKWRIVQEHVSVPVDSILAKAI